MYRLDIEAFVLDDAAEAALREAMGDIALFRSSLRVHRGGLEAAAARAAPPPGPPPDLLVVQTGLDREALPEALGRLGASVEEGTSVLVAGVCDSIDLYRSLKAMGVGGYLLCPFGREAFLAALREALGEGREAERGRVIAVYAAKGGAGASTVAHNLAWTLARRQRRAVSLVDLDLHFGCAAMGFNQDPKYGLRDALAMADKIDDSVLERLFTRESENLWLLASSPSLADPEPPDPQALERVLDAVARASSFVVLDAPHGWQPAVLEALVASDELLVVSEPDLVGLRNAQMVFEALGPSRPQGTATRCVLNKTGLHRATELGARDFAETLGGSPLAALPWDPAAFRTASGNGEMIGETKGRARLQAVFEEIAAKTDGRPNALKEDPGKRGGRGGPGRWPGLAALSRWRAKPPAAKPAP